MENRENFYVLLGLSIEPQEQDETKISNAISKKRNEWSQLRNHPTKAVKAKFYLGLLPEIKRVMLGNVLERKEEWKQALRIKKEEEQKKFRLLDECIELLCSKGCIFEDEIKELQKKLSVFSKEDITSRIKVPVHLNKSSGIRKLETEKTLDPTIMNKINANLGIVNKKDLYEFLNCSSEAPLRMLKVASRYKYERIRKTASKDAINTASSILQGLCDEIFKDEENRKAYDASMKKEKIKYVETILEVAAAKGYISSQEFESLILKMVGEGFQRLEASEYIKNICAKKNISTQIAHNITLNLMQKCGVCGSINYKSSKFCFNCGSPLKVSCPKCHNLVSSSQKVCDNCGFNIKNMVIAADLIRNSEKYIAAGKVESAYVALKQAEALWSENPRLKLLMREVKAKRAVIVDRENKIESLIENNKYYGAMRELIALKKLTASEFIESYENLISSKIAKAEACLIKAHGLEEENELIDLYSSALNICSDCEEALKWLSKYPPKPPRRLNYSIQGEGIKINWIPYEEGKNISYKVVRRLRSEPRNIEDGKLIGDTYDSEIIDYTAEVGNDYYYAVFPSRGGIYSKNYGVIGPIIKISEVGDLEVEAECGKITLSWSSPAKIKEVEVWREEGRVPSKRGEGIKLKNVSLFGVEDEEVMNGHNYGYRIISIYKDKMDREIVTEGITCFGKPTEPPEVIKDIELMREGSRVKAIFKRKSLKGKVYILYSNAPFDIAEGQVIAKDKLSKLGPKIVVTKEGQCYIKNEEQGNLFVIPVVVNSDIAAIGRQKHISIINDVEKLSGYILNKKLYLQWKWPENISKVLIGWRKEEFCIGINDKYASYVEVTLEEYNKAAAFIIDNLNRCNYFFTVFSIVEDTYSKRYSYGSKCKVRNVGFHEIYYEVKRNRGLLGISKSIVFSIKSRGINGEIPKYVITISEAKQPFKSEDGNIVYKGEDEKVILDAVSKEAFIRPFFIAEEDNEKYKFVEKV